ncbi:MAG: allantoicase [Thiothrix lacustris]|uniref:Probable allantoicase n=1 Tax=Thiothrix lacustris TaxID=525917 RepID=A0A1Y1Q9C8_9GAMM|nr:MAG: allantoicase [Thiothrix lacustris]
MNDLLKTLQNYWINLAQPRLGAQAVYATDEFFAPLERLIQPEEPVFIPGKYDDNGKWMDGWETRRKRGDGYDYAIIKICSGVIYGVDLDTAHFTGNFAPSASIEACYSKTPPDENTRWFPLLHSRALQGNSHNTFEIGSREVWNYLRLNIYPDGGVARLRVYGQVRRELSADELDGEIDLAAMLNGGRALCASDMHFGHISNLIAPGKGVNMGDGWETRRRREPGFDWIILRLAYVGTIARLVIDTAHFKGNYPYECSVSGTLYQGGNEDSIATQSLYWQEILPSQRLAADTEFTFVEQLRDIGEVSHLRLNIYPDGGVSRLRAFGKVRREE